MYRVTPRRLKKALPILEHHRAELHKSGRMDARGFEMELRECWDVGYQEMKSLAEDLTKNERYLYVAAYYMEYSNGSRDMIASELKSVLEDLYGFNWRESRDLDAARDKFWAGIPKEV